MLLFNHRFIHQQNGNVIAHRIYSPALPALQAFPCFFLHQRLLAYRANQDVEKLLGDHADILRPLTDQCHTSGRNDNARFL